MKYSKKILESFSLELPCRNTVIFTPRLDTKHNLFYGYIGDTYKGCSFQAVWNTKQQLGIWYNDKFNLVKKIL